MSETGHDNLLLTLGECKHPRGEELFSLVQRAKSRRKDETREGRSKPWDGKANQERHCSPWTEKTISYTFSQISTSVIILIFRHKGGLQTDGLLTLEELKPNTKCLCVEQKVLLPLCKNIAPYSVLLKQCPKNPLI